MGRRSHSHSQDAGRVRPGNIYGLRFGTALATAPATSLRAAFSINLLDSTRINGVRVPTDDVNAFLELGGSAVLSADTAIDILFAAGLTRNTPDFRLMVSVPAPAPAACYRRLNSQERANARNHSQALCGRSYLCRIPAP